MGNKNYGIEKICVETNIGYKIILNNVRHIPKMSLNLISIGVLDDEDYVCIFSNKK